MTNKEYIDYLRVCGKLNIQDKKTIEIINCIEEFDINICNILKHIINIPTIIERRIVLGGLLDLISDIDDNKQNIESIDYIIDTLGIFVRDCMEYIVTNSGSDAIDSTINNIRECINNKYTMKELEDEFNRSRIIRPSKSIKIECNKIRYKLTVCYDNDTEYLKMVKLQGNDEIDMENRLNNTIFITKDSVVYTYFSKNRKKLIKYMKENNAKLCIQV